MQKTLPASKNAVPALPPYRLHLGTRTYPQDSSREFHFYLTSGHQSINPSDGMKIVSSQPLPAFIQKQLLEHPPEQGSIDSGRSVGHSFYSIDEKESNALLTIYFPKQHIPDAKGFGYYAEFLAARYLKNIGTPSICLTNFPSIERIGQLAKVGLPKGVFVQIDEVLRKLWEGVQLSAGKPGPPFRNGRVFLAIQNLKEGMDKVICRVFLDRWGSPSSETPFTAARRDPDSLKSVTKHAVPEDYMPDACVSHLMGKPLGECNRDHLFDFFYYMTRKIKETGENPKLQLSYVRLAESAALQGLAEKFILGDLEDMEKRTAARENPLPGAPPK